MLRSLTFLLFVLPALLPAAAQQPVAPELPDAPEARHSRLRAAKGYYYDDIDGEYCKVIVLNDIAVYPQLKFKNKKEEDFYWKTVYNVRKTLPFAKLICETLIETYEYIETFPTQAERDEYLKRMESAIFEQYKPTLKRFSKSQAQMLCKLIRRETNQSGYNIIKAFLGSFRAGFWPTFGRFFGVNLKADYRPDRDKDDAIIERVATLIELGQL